METYSSQLAEAIFQKIETGRTKDEHRAAYDALDDREKLLVVVTNFTSQVLNGGLDQWRSNGYWKDDGDDLLRLLRGLPSDHHPQAAVLVDIIEAAEDTLRELDAVETTEDEAQYESLLDRLSGLESVLFEDVLGPFEEDLDRWLRALDGVSDVGPARAPRRVSLTGDSIGVVRRVSASLRLSGVQESDIRQYCCDALSGGAEHTVAVSSKYLGVN